MQVLYKRSIYDVPLGWKLKIKPIDVDELCDRKVIIYILEYNLNDADEHKKMFILILKKIKGGGISSANQDEDHLEELENNE